MYTVMFGDYEFPNQTFTLKNIGIENNLKEEVIARKHGSNIQTPYIKSRKLTVGGIIHTTTQDASLTQWLNMQSNLLAGEDKLYYRSDRYINSYVKKISADPVRGSDGALLDVSIDFISQTPFFYSAGASYSVADSHAGGTDTFAVNYEGNVYSEPIVKVYASGGTISNLEMWNLTNNSQSFEYTGQINNGVTIEFDTENYTVLNNGVDGITQFSGEFLTLIPGNNSLQVSGITCNITVEYKKRWY